MPALSHGNAATPATYSCGAVPRKSISPMAASTGQRGKAEERKKKTSRQCQPPHHVRHFHDASEMPSKKKKMLGETSATNKRAPDGVGAKNL